MARRLLAGPCSGSRASAASAAAEGRGPAALVEVDLGQQGVVVRVFGVEPDRLLHGARGLVQAPAVVQDVRQGVVGEGQVGGQADGLLGLLGGLGQLLPFGQAEGQQGVGLGVVGALRHLPAQLLLGQVVARELDQLDGSFEAHRPQAFLSLR